MISNNSTRPIVIAVGGFTSEVGKTTLLCSLLEAFPGWEAIKTTRGHYRSCGKEPHTCCVSDMLEEEAVVRSGRTETYSVGKDTGRYWDSGASNVHWVIATDDQIQSGITTALSRVKAPGVFVEGNSFAQYVAVDHFIMVARSDDLKIKSTARKALPRVSAFYLSDEAKNGVDRLRAFLRTMPRNVPDTPRVFNRPNLAELISVLKAKNSFAAA